MIGRRAGARRSRPAGASAGSCLSTARLCSAASESFDGGPRADRRARRWSGRDRRAGPLACWPAYDAPFVRTSWASVAVVVGRVALRIVLQHAGSANGRLGELDRLADPRLEDELAEVLLEDLDGLLGVDRARVEHRRQDALDLDSRVEVLLDHLERVLELEQPPHRQVLALDRDDHLVGRGQRVDGQQPEARRRVDADEVVVVGDLRERLLERALAADLGRHRDLRPGEVDRGDRDVDLALWITSRIGMWWTRTSNIDFSTLSGSIPWLIVRLPCGSRSTQRTWWPDSAKATARLRVVVVFATPPFWLAKRDHLGAPDRVTIAAGGFAARGLRHAPRGDRLAGGDPHLLILLRLGDRAHRDAARHGRGRRNGRLARLGGLRCRGARSVARERVQRVDPGGTGSPPGSVGSALPVSAAAGSGDGEAGTLASGSVGAGSGDGGAGTLASGSGGGAGRVVCGAGISGSGATACGSATSASPFRV